MFEYLTGGGLLSENLSPALLAEGSMMLQALIDDLLSIPGLELTLLRDCRAPVSIEADGRLREVSVRSEDQLRVVWHEQLTCTDAAWVIAPETGGILERLCRDVECTGAVSLTCPAAAVRITADKAETLRRLEAGGLGVVDTRSGRAIEQAPACWPCVIKPIDGVGGLGNRILRHRASWKRWRTGRDLQRYVMQPLLGGDPLSLSVLFNRGRAWVISCNRQHIRELDDRFVFLGCSVNVLAERGVEWRALAAKTAAALPELWGYAGIDFLYTEAGPVLLEINPRLTTSYVGVRKALGLNVARLVLELSGSSRLPDFLPSAGRTFDVEVDLSHGN